MYRFNLNPAYCKGCGICIAACPKKVIESTGRLDAKGHILPGGGDMSRCTGCRLCELVCPDFAVAIVEDEAAEEKNDVNPD
jgi:2-oxoglutarate ferredoxin oxidoreductase subunit delta